MINSTPKASYEENSIYWTLQNMLLLKELGNEAAAKVREKALVKTIDACRIKEGMFHQNPIHHERDFVQKDGYMSPDQLITFFIVGYLLESKYKKAVFHKEIWKEIKKQGVVKYNNLEDGKLRLIHPRDLVLYLACNTNKFIANLALLFLALTNVIACLAPRDKTTGKLLVWTKCVGLKDHFIVMNLCFKLCTMIITKRHGSWANVFSHFSSVHNREVYFTKDHPNAILSKELYK